MVSQKQRQAGLTHEEEYEIWGLLSHVSDGMLRARENELRPFGITAVQIGVMYVLRILVKSGRPPTPSEISRWAFREPHTISALLDRMERQGLVRRVRKSKVKRQVLVELTKKGEEVYRRQNQAREVISRILGCLSLDERKQFRIFLERLRQKSLEELVVKPSFP